MANAQNNLSLFGESSLDIRNAQEAAGRAEDYKTSQMSGSDGYSYMLAQSGRKLGAAAAGLFGGMDPEVRRATDIEAAFGTLSQDDIANPAVALTKLADQLADKYPKESLEFRLKADQAAQERVTRITNNKTTDLKLKTDTAKYVGGLANGTIEALKRIPNENTPVRKQIWDSYVDKYEEVTDKKSADALRELPETAWDAQLSRDISTNETASIQSRERIATLNAAAKVNAAQVKASSIATQNAIKATADLEEFDKTLSYKLARDTDRNSIEGQRAISERISIGQANIKSLNEELANIDDTIADFRTKINFVGEDTEAIMGHIASLNSRKKIIEKAKQSQSAANDTFTKKYEASMTPQQPQAKQPAINMKAAKAEYATRLEAAKGNPQLITKLQAIAKSRGLTD
jgi:hypothetical protein